SSAELGELAPLARLVEAREGAADRVEALAAWNRAGRLPLRVGIVRELPLPRPVRFGDEFTRSPAGLHAGGAFVRVGADATAWGASVRVEEAHRLRLVLEDVSLPAGTRMWVYDRDGEAVAFGPELAHEGTLWTPSVSGPEIRLELELDRGALASDAGYGFSVARVAEIFRLDAQGAPILGAGFAAKDHDACLVDVSCKNASTFPAIEEASTAVAHLQFPAEQAGFVGVCTGGLLNLAPEAPDDLPFPLLTANHCLSTQGEAANLEAFWDIRSSSCDGAAPEPEDVPRINGATLLATGVESDFTLLELSDFPAPPPSGTRFVLGWDSSVPELAPGTELHRISYPVTHQEIHPQRYTRYRVLDPDEFNVCEVEPSDPQVNDPEKFHHTVFLEGGTFGGSSGGPIMRGNGQVVGQLFGACGQDPQDGCSKDNDELDGNFYTTFPFIEPFLGVTQGDEWLTTPELPGFEFQVEITPAGGSPVAAEQTSQCIPETFCVEGLLGGRPEVFVKIIGPRPNDFLWVQITRFTPSKVDVWVRQVSTGDVNQYTLDVVGPGTEDLSGLQDRQAFSP
ncbi:MAG: hypothetical protein ACOC7L_02995, partial [Acidobacteriota bacterium]